MDASESNELIESLERVIVHSEYTQFDRTIPNTQDGFLSVVLEKRKASQLKNISTRTCALR